tara:strand:+ start:13 stop:435 length:423 start_codon:yes stop_codon:yes gene_type:complete
MKDFLEGFIAFSIGLSCLGLMKLFQLFPHEVSFQNIALSLSPIAITSCLYLIYLKVRKKLFEIEDEEDEYEEGEIVLIFGGIPLSNKNGIYSEGVFFWVENGSLLTTLEFHLEQGGDPDVFNQWLEQEKENPQYLQPTLQ